MVYGVSDQTNKEIDNFYSGIDSEIKTHAEQYIKRNFPDRYRPAVKDNVKQIIIDFMELRAYREQLGILFKRAINMPIQNSPQYSEPLQMIDKLVKNGRDMQGIKQYVFDDRNYQVFKDRLNHLKSFCKEQAAFYLEFKNTGNPELLRNFTPSNYNMELAGCDYAYSSGMYAMNNYYTFIQLNNPAVYRTYTKDPQQPIKRPSTESIRKLRLKKFIQKAGRTLDDVFNRIYDAISSIPSRRTGSTREDEEWQRIIDENRPKEETVEEINARLERDHRRRAENAKSFDEHMRSRAKPDVDGQIMTLE